MANAISRMDATQSILSVVVPRCQESNLRNFYTDFGNYFLDKYPPVMGTLSEMHRTLLIKRFGEEVADGFDKLRKDVKLGMFIDMKNEFNDWNHDAGISIPKIYKVSTEPTTQVVGDFWYNTTTNIMTYWNGTAWV